MTKIIINADFGGFSLSPDAVEAYLEKQGKKAYWFKAEFISPIDGREYTRTEKPEQKSIFGSMCFTTEDHQEDSFFSDHDVKRDDPLLIEIVETLGVEKASGALASLRIVEIPDDVEWVIEEYDGSEWISEKHRTWR